ncbi:DNA damage-inducible transcript 4-like protein-like [Corythoichthys intestinalis]|uniref:DNA damage-inducible transcript 4-like protein-like n=1 Tax=Corythoichthys intestinalis TaxID=161448 RepID=UPI0025A62FF5|nr:DNA damage-inducible transcript 4-like protein-like [Corythoichthys intestinalis]XP_061792604.1 DNA damage-inducible transcript 4-like protein [Nerophis lumbriciformis]
MVYTPAVLFGKKLPVLGEEESVTDMIGTYFFRLASLRQEDSSVRRGSIDSFDDTGCTLSYPNMDVCLEHEAKALQQDLKCHIERCLSEAKASVLQCKVLLLPCQMTTKVGRDILHTSTDEPCGLRGASIRVYVETKDGLKSLGGIFPVSNVTPTFELSIVFKADKSDCWPPLKRIFERNKVLKLRPEYKLVKRKLYSSASPVIHEFN